MSNPFDDIIVRMCWSSEKKFHMYTFDEELQKEVFVQEFGPYEEFLEFFYGIPKEDSCWALPQPIRLNSKHDGGKNVVVTMQWDCCEGKFSMYVYEKNLSIRRSKQKFYPCGKFLEFFEDIPKDVNSHWALPQPIRLEKPEEEA